MKYKKFLVKMLAGALMISTVMGNSMSVQANTMIIENSINEEQEPNLLIFEEKVDDFITCNKGSKLEISDKHSKFGDTSLKWSISGQGEMYVDAPIGYEIFEEEGNGQARESFVVWIYNENPSNENLIFEFGTDKGKEAWFEFGLDFKGWRCAWVMFDRDMEGAPSEEMDKLTIKAPKSMDGKDLYFGNMVLSTPIDARHHTRTEQTPFVNVEADSKANSHWMSLYTFNERYKQFTIDGDSTAEEKEDIKVIEDKFTQYIADKKKNIVPFETLKKTYESYEIKLVDGTITGKNINYNRAYTPFDEFDKSYYMKKFESITAKNFTKTMYEMAVFYDRAPEGEEKNKAKEMFLKMFWQLHDQGFARGSSVGTVTHLGYELRDYAPALYIMKDVLQEEGCLKEAQEALAWFYGTGRIFYEDIKAEGINIDTLNTQIEGILTSILMLEDENEKVELLRQFTKWLTFACSAKPGLEGPFKYDGTGFHHANFYPAYTRDALNGVTPIIYLLSGTTFRLPEEQHEIVKKATLNFRLFSNKEQVLISASGRHPHGNEKLSVNPFKYMALAGTPDGKFEIDKEVAASYMRLKEGVEDQTVKDFEKMGITKEASPNGNWSMNYANLALHRRDEWLVGVRGHSKYLWANETYQDANLYGRYITHGQIQIMSQGSPVNHKDSGYYHDGWDWNSWPGTTTVHLPVDKLKSDVKNLDTLSGFEEMLLSDETYAGSLNLQGENGMFAMKLHEHPKYEGSHRARKSVFMFDDRIIALGSNIENNNKDNPTRTTLFQNYLTDVEEPIFVNNTEPIKGLDYNKELKLSNTSFLLDNNNNGYILSEGQNITITRSLQESRDQKNGSKTEGEFAKAVIEHGYAPQDEDYEYMIVVDTNVEELVDMKKDMDSIYTVLQKDRNAHIVKDHQTNTIAYALFEAGNAINKGEVVGIDTPAMVMTKPVGDKLILSICDPDLRLYEGIDESQYDEEGNRKEVSLYSREWLGNESQLHTLNLEIKGIWKLEDNNKFRIVEYRDGNTVVAVDCKDAEKTEITLRR